MSSRCIEMPVGAIFAVKDKSTYTTVVCAPRVQSRPKVCRGCALEGDCCDTNCEGYLREDGVNVYFPLVGAVPAMVESSKREGGKQ